MKQRICIVTDKLTAKSKEEFKIINEFAELNFEIYVFATEITQQSKDIYKFCDTTHMDVDTFEKTLKSFRFKYIIFHNKLKEDVKKAIKYAMPLKSFRISLDKYKLNDILQIPKKILIVRLGAIGDVVHTTNVFRSIKKQYSNVEIHYLTSMPASELLINDPDLAKVWTIDPKEMKLSSAYLKQYAQEIKSENFDLAINLQPSLKIRFLLWKAGIEKTLIYRKSFKLHAVTNFWQTALAEFNDIAPINDLKIYLSQKTENEISTKINNLKHPFIVFNAGGVFAKRQGRTYPLEKWLELGGKIQKEFNGTIFLTGAQEDAEFLKVLETIPNTINCIGRLSLRESAAIFAKSDLLISGDSGPLHIATAVGTKTIGLFGSMPVGRTGAYGDGHKTIRSEMTCVPCNKRKCKYLKKAKTIYAPCMNSIEVDEVLRGVDEIVKKEEVLSV